MSSRFGYPASLRVLRVTSDWYVPRYTVLSFPLLPALHSLSQLLKTYKLLTAQPSVICIHNTNIVRSPLQTPPLQANMQLIQSFSAILALVSLAPSLIGAQRVVGAPEGFAAGTSGGGNAQPIRPRDNNELTNLLKDNTPRVIVLDREYNFVNTQGRTKAQGCAPWSTKPGCQLAINGAGDWCGREQSKAPKVQVDYDNAGLNPLIVGSSKTILGVGSQGKIRGKGLRVNNGARNVIIQNIEIVSLAHSALQSSNLLTNPSVRPEPAIRLGR